MMARTAERKAFRILTVIDEYAKECLAILPSASDYLAGCNRAALLSVHIQEHP